jgi:ubiquinone/menaquinone biosynthesis C-methylase UbiE
VPEIAPVARTKAQAQATYDRRSRGYERLEGRFERHARIAGERLLAVERGERVLEIGSGPGASLAAFAVATGADGHVVGVDLAPNMHRVATERIRAEQLASRVSLVVADGARIPLAAGSVDAAFACFTLELFDTPELLTVLGELDRVLAAGGRLAVVSLTTTEPPALMERAYLAAHRLMPRLADCRPIPAAALVAEAGFRVAQERRSDIFGIPVIAVAAVSTR